MTAPVLESVAVRQNYAALPEVWRVLEIGRFSRGKALYDYQRRALENAASLLFQYYGDRFDWRAGEDESVDDARKSALADAFAQCGKRHPDSLFSVPQYETAAKERDGAQNSLFVIYADYITPDSLSSGARIAYRHRINRMNFWMATGSGKTLVMVKLIEYLRRLSERGEIPPHNILLLAPSEHLLRQIRVTVDEFNAAGGLHIALAPLSDARRGASKPLGDAVVVYYHRSDNIADAQTEARINFRDYADGDEGGKWFILLDEAHKGGKEDSKRQAYYALMARRGFLFNFSATFTEAEDIAAAVCQYNLQKFIGDARGKNIYLSEAEFDSFKDQQSSGAQKRRIVLKSLIALAFAVRRAAALRAQTGRADIYHSPLMLTLVNSVNTDIAGDKNDLWAFFQILRQIAADEIDDDLFAVAKEELAAEWQSGDYLFGASAAPLAADARLDKMTVDNLREAVFLSAAPSALQYIRGADDKEIAFQLHGADRPFALIRIGDTAKWRNQLLAGYEEGKRIGDDSFFNELEQSPITILMGSRAFFESWDSNRPNVINFINIGGQGAKKFVVQSVGRGVRIEPLPGRRGRASRLMPPAAAADKATLRQIGDSQVAPLETLFLFATNKGALKAILESLKQERESGYQHIGGFVKSSRPKINGAAMPLLVPEYREKQGRARAEFRLAESARARFAGYIEQMSSALLAVRNGYDAAEIGALRAAAQGAQGGMVVMDDGKEYDNLNFLRDRLIGHLRAATKTADGMRELDEDKDIVHFREISARLDNEQLKILREKVGKVARGGGEDINTLTSLLQSKEISADEFKRRLAALGAEKDTFDGLQIKRVAAHYYAPLIAGESGKADFIRHIVKTDSERAFLAALEEYLAQNTPPWTWMFSKIDERLDNIFIPYYDGARNEYADFYPDFVFWSCRADQYRIVFVDPHGAAHQEANHKTDGYRNLFERDKKPREFTHGAWKVRVRLLFFNNNPAAAPEDYRRHWTRDTDGIFADD